MSRECKLSQLPAGTKARVRSVDGCPAARNRLCAMGFTPGVEVEVCGACGGECRVQLRDCCVILCQGFAGNIRCDVAVEQSA